MAEFRTPTTNKCRSRLQDNPDLQTPIKIPPSPYLEKIGYGTYVNVFTLERSPKVGFVRSPWALKKVNRNALSTKAYNTRICLEAEILCKLNHPNIVGFRAFTKASHGEACLVMEKLEVSLGDIIEGMIENDMNPFSADDILRIGFEVAKGLEYLHHTVYILHGDLKSYNVLVSDNCKVVKLCDFGVSLPLTKSLELDRSKGQFEYVGTECWSAPEIIDMEGPVTNKADMWAYGLVIWEMIALSPPYVEHDDSIFETSFDDSFTANEMPDNKENSDPNLDESVQLIKEITRKRFGMRPALPAIELGPEYKKVLELFYTCTDADYKSRPTAKGVVMFFKNYVYPKSEKAEKETECDMDCDI
ncbi:lymphokine-activated killer T-cell-originated protein kinase [Cephus cinctus]|uniref:Lymphokine-activated killer T-cell-originated protein kinase n=1 Tax=Cephus cinctus TaxID=211228 RepID=A0AAJ7C5D9_CEPCN|nr:lymphokine-activated killer T-cell-originated protein kinase [Cephus cinctus]